MKGDYNEGRRLLFNGWTSSSGGIVRRRDARR